MVFVVIAVVVIETWGDQIAEHVVDLLLVRTVEVGEVLRDVLANYLKSPVLPVQLLVRLLRRLYSDLKLLCLSAELLMANRLLLSQPCENVNGF